MKQRIITLIALLCTFAGTASATTKTYTVSGGQGNSPTEFYAQFSDGSTSSGQVNWTYNSTAEISFNLPGGLTLKLSDAAKQLSVSNNNTIGGRGSTTLTVSSTTYIYHVRILDSSGNVIQLDANGEAVAHDGVAECDYWNMTKSFSHTFSNGILFSKIEVSYATAIPITDAVITGLSSQYIVSNTAIMPTPTVTWHGTTLTSGTHYTLSYQNNTAAGTATVKATGSGIFSSSTSVSANYTLVWATYSVRFNKNNDAATGTMANQAFTYNTAQALTANGFTREGYTYAGWNTAADGSGTSYADGQSVSNLTATNGGTVDLYAQWTPITYTLRLHHNDGTGAYTDMAMTYDQSKNIQSISRTGYTFDGWSTTADGAVVYTDQQEVSNLTATDGGTVDLYAQWTAITYSITYDLAGGTVATANPTSYSIESNNFTLANPTRTGYTFAGWTGTDLNEPTMEVTIPTGSTEHRSYTATWTAHTYSVHFDKNSDSATGTIADQAFTYGVSHQLTANAFTAPVGYQFYRWTTNADGSGDSYTNQQEINNLTAENGATLTLYAQWEVVPWSGTGSSKTPYIISYPSQLDLLATRVNSGNEYRGEFFKLGADIAYDPTALDANGENYTAIGNRTYGFRGTFDGDGHTVSGIRINKTGTTNADRCQGLFGNVGILGTVQNVILDDAHIIGYNQVGGITGSMSSATIKNCLVLNTAIIATYANSSNVGAISGFNSGTLTANYYHNCSLTKGGTTSTTNIGSGGNSISDLDGARSVHVLTLPDGVGATGVSVVIDGTTYYASNTTVTLTYTGEVPTGYHVAYSVNGTPIEGSSFTMPAADATVTVTLTDVWNIANYADGSQEHPYVITTTAGLDLLAKNVNGTDGYTANDFNGKYFVLDSDISYTHTTDWNNAASTENNYTAIGGRFNDNNIYFRGTFDGQGHTVSGIRIYKGGATEADSYQGLFGKTEGATIRHVILADARITGNKDVGGIAGFITYNNNSITLENCRVRNDVTIHAVANNAYNHGGVVGACNGGTISGCVSSATLTVAGGLNGIDSYGGIVGYLSGNLSDCLAVGVAIPDVTRSGAIAGDIGSSVLSNNFYSGCTLGGTPTASGIGVGRDSYNSVRHDVTANNGAVPYTTLHTLTLGENITATGALLNQGGTISVPAGSTVTLSYSGLLDGQIVVFTLNDNELSGNSFTMPAADATVSASAFTAWGTDKGADGSAEHPYVITRTQELNLLAERVNSGNDFGPDASHPNGYFFVLDADITYTHTTDWNDATSKENNYSPIGGYFNSDYCWFRGTFDGQGHTVSGIRIYKGNATEADSYQGLFGNTRGATIRNVNLADARITGYQFVGGIAGYIATYDDNGSIVENCRVGNDVTIHAVANSASFHGGVVGYCNRGTISGCVSSATLTVAGGLTNISYYGGIVGYEGNISNCLAVGVAIPNVTDSGAIAGYIGSRVLSNNFYSGCTLGGTPTASGIGVGMDNYNPARHDVTANNGAVPALRDQASNTQAIALLAVLAQADAAHPLLPLDLGWGPGKFPLQLADRTLYKDGDWNTLCLPFSLTAEQIAASPLAGAEARTLSSASYADGELTLNFSEPVETLTAGSPYIIRWEKAEGYVAGDSYIWDITDPLFENVSIDCTARNVETANVTFTGTYDAMSFAADNRSILFLGAGNTLYYPRPGAYIDAFRAYFQLNGISATDLPAGNVKMFFGDERPTDGVGEVQGPKFKVQGEDSWYDLDGRRISGKPTQRGIYINNGHKVVIK